MRSQAKRNRANLKYGEIIGDVLGDYQQNGNAAESEDKELWGLSSFPPCGRINCHPRESKSLRSPRSTTVRTHRSINGSPEALALGDQKSNISASNGLVMRRSSWCTFAVTLREKTRRLLGPLERSLGEPGLIRNLGMKKIGSWAFGSFEERIQEVLKKTIDNYLMGTRPSIQSPKGLLEGHEEDIPITP
uniref:Protein Nef n=1 Tax=Steinernema glaseri TaxID=37863 RepID=A0A1I7Z2G7_9BILA